MPLLPGNDSNIYVYETVYFLPIHVTFITFQEKSAKNGQKNERSLLSYATHHAKKDFVGIEKSIDSDQPAQSAQSDHGRNFSLLADFLCIK